MTRAEPPFDGVDLILISHAHPDHFDPQIVGTLLQYNPQAALVSMASVIDELKNQFPSFAKVKDRVHGFQLGDKEKVLLDYLSSHDRITMKGFKQLVNISPRRASRILVNLVRAELIRLHSMEDEDFYTLS